MAFFWKKKEEKSRAEIEREVISWQVENAQDEETRRYFEAQADKQYQEALSEFYTLTTTIKETYSVLTNLASYDGGAAERLIARCATAMELDDSIREKRAYYDNAKYEYCEPYKILAMLYEKRGEYQRAAMVCVLAIEKGYTKDGTSGGMRGRLARMIKKGDLPISEQMKEILSI